MSLYDKGMAAPGGIIIPEPAHQAWQRFNDAHWGFRQVRRGEGRFYQRGITGQNQLAVGAATGGPVGTFVDAIVNLMLDVGHVLLIIAGMYALWKAIAPV